MPTKRIDGQLFDARPDRIDFRDFPYRPPLKNLPHQYPSPAQIKRFAGEYSRDKMILDQGKAGSCTGFGLAAVINYLTWEGTVIASQGSRRKKKRLKAPDKVCISMPSSMTSGAAATTRALAAGAP
jgi:hypothetical protein